MSTKIRGADNFDTADNATQTELDNVTGDGKGVAIAWVSFDTSSGTPVINYSYNVSNLVLDDIGRYTLTFSSANLTANYILSGTVQFNEGTGAEDHDGVSPISSTTTTISFSTGGVSIYKNCLKNNIVIFGGKN